MKTQHQGPRPVTASNTRGPNLYTVIHLDCIPPSVNTYVRHTRNGAHYRTDKAKSFADELALKCTPSSRVYGVAFEVEISITLGPHEKGDIDNFPKVVLDSIARRGMFRNMKGEPMSDSHVTRLTVSKERGERSHTMIEVIGVRC
jgi:crossover junction endodeoxyribonuclease RusA